MIFFVKDMVVKHVVLFKFIHDKTSKEMEYTSEQVKSLYLIPGVLDVSFGPTFTKRGKGYTHCLVVDLLTEDALNIYATHPVHLDFINKTKGYLEQDGVLAMDYLK